MGILILLFCWLNIMPLVSGYLGEPYIPTDIPSDYHTQDIHHINKGYDCMTLVEDYVARLTHTEPSQNRYIHNITNYAHRRHYLSQYFQYLITHHNYHWLQTNNSIQRSNTLNFLSRLLASKDTPKHVTQTIQQYEQNSKHTPKTLKYFDCTMIAPDKQLLRAGMLIGFVSNVKGLDFNHTAILANTHDYKFIHASSIKEQVVLSEKSVFNYCRDNQKTIGLVFLEMPQHATRR